MINKAIPVTEIISFLGESVVAIDGIPDNAMIDNLADTKHVTASTLDWVKPSPHSQQVAEASNAKTLLVGLDVFFSSSMAEKQKILIHVKNPKHALAKIGNAFFIEKMVPGIHSTAIISPKAKIGHGVYIGPHCVIGEAIIGDDSRIDSNACIYDGVTLGLGCRVKAGAVIGGEGFGFERDEEGNLFRFPQIGHVIIGNNVEIGANTCIDRGALSDTIIGDYTKINNLCHIAHNNVIGRNVVIAGCVNISGSNIIENNVWIAPHVCVRGFLKIGEKCVIGMGAVVTKDIPAGETWIGNPAHKLEK